MNRLESAVRAVMRECHLANLSDVADRIGVPKSNLSKILSGQLGLSPTNLRKLVSGISGERVHQFTILSAHLYDEAERAGFALPLLDIQFENRRSGDGISFTDLPEDLQRNLRLLGDEIKNGNDELRGTLEWITGMIRTSRGVYPQGPHQSSHPLAAEPETSHGPVIGSPVAEEIAKAKAGGGGGRSPGATPPRRDPSAPRPATK